MRSIFCSAICLALLISCERAGVNEPCGRTEPTRDTTGCGGFFCGAQGDGSKTIQCKEGLNCVGRCFPDCPDRQQYECASGECACEFIYPQLGEACSEMECDVGFLCAIDRTADPVVERCVLIDELYCETNADCLLNVCRENGLCADRLLNEPCQQTAQCSEGACTNGKCA